MNPGQISCSSCSATFSVATGAKKVTCPGCGQVLSVAQQAKSVDRLPSKTLPLTSGPRPVRDTPDPVPDPFGDDLPGMVEGDEIDMDFFEASAEPAPPRAPAAPAGPATPPPMPDDVPEIQQMPPPKQRPAPAKAPKPPAKPKKPAPRPAKPEPDDAPFLEPIAVAQKAAPPPAEQPPAADEDEVLGKIELRKAADDIPEAGPLAVPVEEKKPVKASREVSKPPPNILAGPATPPIKLPDQGIEVTIPLAPVEEVSRHDTGSGPTMDAEAIAARTRQETAELSPSQAAKAPRAYKQTGAQKVAAPASSRKFIFIGVAVAGVLAAAAVYILLGN